MEPVPAPDEETHGVLPGTYAGSRPSAGVAPPEAAFDGRGETVPAEPGPLDPADRRIVDAIASEAEWTFGLLSRLVDADTTLGREEEGQRVMEEAFRELGLEPVDVPMDGEALRAHPGHSPFAWDVAGKRNVVATWGVPGGGRSLILNGHVDVVPSSPVDGWRSDPFTAVREGDWLYGRGAADMKCGLAAMVGAVKGLRALGMTPNALIHLESVVEEECTGNGTLACLLAGYTADAAVITEPFGAAITTSQVGVLWFKVRVRGVPGHAADEAAGVNAIERSLSITQALRRLEAELNAAPPPPYDRFSHPINLNIGAIHGGDWASTVPGECVTSYRIALYPGMRVRDLQDRIEAVVAETALEDPGVLSHPPEIVYDGFACDGYEIAEDSPLVSALAEAFGRQSGRAPALVATTGTTDARVLGLAGGIPSVCFGPYAEQSHGVDERVYLPSVVQTAQVLGLFIRDWCGLSG